MAFDKEELGRRIKNLRKGRNLTQEELAKLATLTSPTRQAISQIERGKVAPSLELLEELKRNLSTTFGELLD